MGINEDIKQEVGQHMTLFGTVYYARDEGDDVGMLMSIKPKEGYMKMDGSAEAWALLEALFILDGAPLDGAGGDSADDIL